MAGHLATNEYAMAKVATGKIAIVVWGFLAAPFVGQFGH